MTRHAAAPPEEGDNYTKFRAARDLLLRYRDDHEAACRAFRWPEFSDFNWAFDWFDRVARGNPATALRVVRPAGIQDASFDTLSRRSSQVAGGLRSLGVGRGEVVCILLDNMTELWLLLLALIKIRAVAMPLFTEFPAGEVADRMHRAAARHIVADAAIIGGLDLVPPGGLSIAVGGRVPGWIDFAAVANHPAEFAPDGPTPADEISSIFFTSGTTGRPKLVAHTHTSYPVGHLTSMYWNGLRPKDVHVNVSSPGWAKHPWSSFFAPWNAEATVVAIDTRHASPALVLETLERAGATSFCCPPSIWRALIKYGLDCRSIRLREAVSVGEPLADDIVSHVRDAWGLAVRNGYGQSEVTALIGVSAGMTAADPVCLGRPLPGYRISLRPPGSVAESAEGELCVGLDPRPAGMMRGYLGPGGSPPTPGQEAFYRTGDLARWNADGSLSYVGRLRDVFEDGDGMMVAPAELERVLLAHPAVAEAAVVPVRSAGGVLVPKAYIILAQRWNATAATAMAVLTHANSDPSRRRISVLEFVDLLPRTESGKIHRDVLRGYPRSELTEFPAPTGGPSPQGQE